MDYATDGSLRQFLNNNFSWFYWELKLRSLYQIAIGLADIHDKELIHHDFHCGNILYHIGSHSTIHSAITDLGLCKPASEKSEKSEKRIYGLLPYVAPEVLRGKEYTQAGDIYGFGIVSYEICTGYPPYHDIEHDDTLAIKICNGQRPKSNYKIPQLVLDIIKQCLDADPLKRPKVKELNKIFLYLYADLYHDRKDSEIYKQAEEADEINKNLPSSSSLTGALSYTTHPQAIYTSRLLNFKNLPEPKNDDDSSGIEYSGNYTFYTNKIICIEFDIIIVFF